MMLPGSAIAFSTQVSSTDIASTDVVGADVASADTAAASVPFWWEIVAALAPVGTLAAAVVAAIVGLSTIRQRSYLQAGKEML
ncbi:hypothetical protein RBS60_10685 [Sinomonas sp. ASV486]|uniref:Uncharacterized protein n=1 Tax=Sinomonas puerhi TaxID=3238584 RepID=A0AB39KZ01_9MICC|nr:hypothetical protein [Sinomonas sp. ASV486]MDQ4490664.1 hypothetical protein [Sinomonas sp. ASV486]